MTSASPLPAGPERRDGPADVLGRIPVQRTEPSSGLTGSRVGLAETVTHTGTWQWDALTDAFTISRGLEAILQGRQPCPDVDLLLANAPGLAAVVGRDPREALPGSLPLALALPTAEDRAGFGGLLASAWLNTAGFEVNHDLGTGHGSVPVRHVGQVVTDTDGRATGVVGALTVQPDDDVSDPTGDVESARRYRQLIKVLPSGVVIHQDGVIVEVNPALLALAGYDSPDDLLGKKIIDMIVPEGRRRLMERVLAMSQQGAVAAAEEEVLLLPDGTRIPVEITSIRTTWRGRPAGQAVVTDIRERQANLDRLRHDATHDALTGLGNRRLIVKEIHRRLTGRRVFSVLFVDLDKFKDVNDSFGHAVGDSLLLKAVAGLRTVADAHGGTFVGRLSGDEFVLVAPGTVDAEKLACDICAKLAEPFMIDTWELVVTSSVGILRVDPVLYADTQPLDVIRDADMAMYQAKKLGRNRWVTFDETMRQSLQRKVVLTDYLRRTVESPEMPGIRLLFQPILTAADSKPYGVETLVRWHESRLGPVSPDEFIPVAEETGLIVPLGRWILRAALQQVASWRAAHPKLSDLHVAINLSPRQFSDPELVPTVREALRETGLVAEHVCLEITETALSEDADLAAQRVLELRELGVVLSIDDFGTGYSSISYLRNLPVNELKVDRSFVSGLGENVQDETICASIVSMAKLLGLKVAAEGVETQQQQDHLNKLGCDYIQGYFRCRPVGADEAVAYLLGIAD